MMPARAVSDERWREWMVALGARVRHLRELVGLSQEQLARQAGVSQGAISRLEMGRGLNTPLLGALKVYGGLATALREVEPALLTDDARALVAQLQAPHMPAEETDAPASVSFLVVPEFEEVVRLCSRVPGARRAAFVKVVQAVASVLCGAGEDAAGCGTDEAKSDPARPATSR
jgi:transcriptional regulator with XRE-family HTH domain